MALRACRDMGPLEPVPAVRTARQDATGSVRHRGLPIRFVQPRSVLAGRCVLSSDRCHLRSRSAMGVATPRPALSTLETAD
eukprot:scaffold447_cov307-Pinguiococcus_pyrenoidosus.AAC.6